MTTSRETDNLEFAALRALVHIANTLALADRLVLLKALIPCVVCEMSPRDFESLIFELRRKGERYYEAANHPGEGRAQRHVMGERDIEAR